MKFGNLLHMLTRSKAKREHNPTATWLTLLSLAVIFVLAEVAIGVYLFASVGGVDSSGENTEITVPISLNQTLLGETLTSFEERAARFEVLKSGRVEVRDPSR